jgi:hypothetical protein
VFEDEDPVAAGFGDINIAACGILGDAAALGQRPGAEGFDRSRDRSRQRDARPGIDVDGSSRSPTPVRSSFVGTAPSWPFNGVVTISPSLTVLVLFTAHPLAPVPFVTVHPVNFMAPSPTVYLPVTCPASVWFYR